MSDNKDIEIYNELLRKYRPGIKTMLADIIYKIFISKNKTKQSIYDDSEFRYRSKEFDMMDLTYIAIVIDKEVKETIRLNSTTAELLLSKYSTLIPFNIEIDGMVLGMEYSDGKFKERDPNA